MSPRDESPKSVRVLVIGRVQGVCFRASARERALTLGLDGWVRNLPDGSVEASITGPEDTVEAMIAWCHEGSPLARVREVRVEPEPSPAAVGDGFRVRF